MFSNLRQNSLFYILDKNNGLKLKVGKIISTSNPQRYGMPAPTIDVTVDCDGEKLEFNGIPSSLSIATYGLDNIVIAESPDVMLTEVDNTIQNSQQILNNIDYHKKVIDAGPSIFAVLDPRYAKNKEQSDRLNALENKVIGIDNNLSEIKAILLQNLNKTTTN